MPEKQIVCGKLYASWCHYCKELKGPWKRVLQLLQRDKSLVCVSKEVALGDVQDEQKQKDLLKSLTQELQAKQDIEVKGGYPTIFKLDPFNNVVYYEEGPRTVEGLYQFFTGKSLTPSLHTSLNTRPASSKKQTRREGGCGWSWFTQKRKWRRRSSNSRRQRKF